MLVVIYLCALPSQKYFYLLLSRARKWVKVFFKWGRGAQIYNYSQRFEWDFVITDVAQPLLGADFFCHHGRLVDSKNISISFSGNCNWFSAASRHFLQQPFAQLLTQFLELTCPTFFTAIYRSQH